MMVRRFSPTPSEPENAGSAGSTESAGSGGDGVWDPSGRGGLLAQPAGATNRRIGPWLRERLPPLPPIPSPEEFRELLPPLPPPPSEEELRGMLIVTALELVGQASEEAALWLEALDPSRPGED